MYWPSNLSPAAAALFSLLTQTWLVVLHQARSMIIQRGEQIGLDWEGTMQQLQQQDWEAAMAAVQNKQLQYPSYYTQPFHAYAQVPHGGGRGLMVHSVLGMSCSSCASDQHVQAVACV
jgi:hypothetical protein